MTTETQRDRDQPRPWLEETVELEPEPVELESAGSVLDVIRERRNARAPEHEYDMLVPGYGDLLVLRCTPIKGEDLTRLRVRIERSKDPTRDFKLAADILHAVVDNVLARRRVGAELEPLDPTGEPVGITDRLAELLRVEATTARELVLELFSLAPSPEMACGDAVGDYLAWAQGADADLDDGLMGE